MSAQAPTRPEADVSDAARSLERRVEALPGVRGASVALVGERQVRELRIRAADGAAHAVLANAADRMLRREGFDFTPDAIRVLSLSAEAPAELPATLPELDTSGARAPALPPPARTAPDHAEEHPGHPEPGSRAVVANSTRLPSAPHGRYLVLSDLAVRRSGPRVTCTVRLRCADVLCEGSAEEMDSEPGRARAGARAALEAASAAVEGMAFGLEGATTVELFGRRHVALSVEAAAGRRVATLSAMVVVEPIRSIEEAGALAALRAIDRWIAS